jgi:hypothetical protein
MCHIRRHQDKKTQRRIRQRELYTTNAIGGKEIMDSERRTYGQFRISEHLARHGVDRDRDGRARCIIKTRNEEEAEVLFNLPREGVRKFCQESKKSDSHESQN